MSRLKEFGQTEYLTSSWLLVGRHFIYLGEIRMQTYIGVKCVEAEPCEKDGKDGYRIIYPDGYESWSPEEAFERYYFPITRSDKLTQQDINNWMGGSIVTAVDGDKKTTVVKVEMPTGFVEWDAASCVSPKNYDREMGKKIALEHIEDRVWRMLGFVLQWGKYGLRV